ncbi:hypothetical protein E3N88_39707 [Mikania micrantha]|uniref:Reverse transcriptase/retrotransposon-derived protein RNase H-like domain-containing protein n=1 Tax=Mikania micrantha TaxID=192012 RepID=A0A5N6LKJ0_9ASTR|nr:hypothetical protein E3N88_39707 [Mikania micrantha]
MEPFQRNFEESIDAGAYFVSAAGGSGSGDSCPSVQRGVRGLMDRFVNSVDDDEREGPIASEKMTPTMAKEQRNKAPNCTYKEGWIYFNDEAVAAFDKLKQALITAPILRLPNFNAPFIVECDASSEVIYAILIQDDHPVAYYSTAFTPSTYFKSAYDRQLLDLVMG